MASLAWARPPAKPVSDLTAGDYPALVSILGKKTYEPQVLHKLTRPKLIWYDEAWFRENGYAVPPRPGKAFEASILDALAWAMPLKGEPDDAFGEETQTFYADRYGGRGIGAYRGSGRAASKGGIQIKGTGPTNLLDAWEARNDAEHSSGHADLWEGVNEILASQIANAEMAYGANRVIALIDTGTIYWDSERKQWIPRVLIVREDPLRPAHFMKNARAKRTKLENDRIEFVMGTLDRALPQPSGSTKTDRASRIRDGLGELIDRHAKVAAQAYANRFFHNSLSPSNEEINGAALDFGAFMALEGYARAGRLRAKEFNGETAAVETVLREFLEALRNQISPTEKILIPSNEDAIKRFLAKYEADLNYEMVFLTGLPPEFLQPLYAGETVKVLGQLLTELAKSGNYKPIDALNERIGRPGDYDMPRVFQRLATTVMLSSSSISSLRLRADLEFSLRSEILDESIRNRLVDAYRNILIEVAKEAGRAGIREDSLSKYMVMASEIRNRRSPHLIYDSVSAAFWYQRIESYMTAGSVADLRQAISAAIHESRTKFSNVAPYTLVLRERRKGGGRVERDVFNLKTGQTETAARSLGPDCSADLEFSR